MAVINHILLSELEDEIRFDPQYYTPENMLFEEELKAFQTIYLGSVASITDGQHGYFKLDENSEIRQITAKCIKEGLIDKSNADRLSYITHNNNLRSSLAVNDVLVTTAGTIGQIGLVTEEIPPANIDQDIGRIAIHNNGVSPYFVWAFLQSKFGRFQIERFTTGQVQTHLSLKKMKKLRIPLLSNHAEVEEIVKRFVEYKIAAKELYAKAQQLLEYELGLDKLRFDKPMGYTARFSELELSRRADPEYFDPVAASIVSRITEFEHVKLGSSFTVCNGFPWNSKKFLNDNSGEPVVRIRNIKPTHIDIDELTSIEPAYTLKVGFHKASKSDIVVGMDGIKYFYASLLEGDCYVNQRVAHLKQLPSAKISPEYVTFIINSRIGQAQLLRDMTIATTVGHITNRNIAKLVIPYVSDSFHDQITSLVRESIDKKQQSKQLLDQVKTCVEQLIEEAVRT